MNPPIKLNSGTLFIKNEDKEDYTVLGTVTDVTIGMEPKIHKMLKKVCKFSGIAIEGGRWADVCRHPKNIHQGTSWGQCHPWSCPMASEICNE